MKYSKSQLQMTIVSPSVREGWLDIVAKCLNRQTLKNWEWITACNYNPPAPASNIGIVDRRELFYSLNRDWNRMFKEAKGDLIVSIVDGLWFPPDTLERLWMHYQTNSKSCVSCIGHQYDKIENGKPEHMVWKDPRARSDFGSFYEVPHTEIELCVASFPKQAIIDVGGIDEEFDKYAALSEKEMMARMYKAGYKTYIDQSIEYRAIKHDRLSPEWDARYNAGWPYYEKCIKEIETGKRLKLNFI